MLTRDWPSTVSSSLGYVLSTTYKPLETAKFRRSMLKSRIQQVILQAMNTKHRVLLGPDAGRSVCAVS